MGFSGFRCFYVVLDVKRGNLATATATVIVPAVKKNAAALNKIELL
jgi:hypothetical protein